MIPIHTDAVSPAAPDPQQPLFDPAGMFWQVNRELVLLLGGGAALLSQVAHPLVAAGVYEHSGFREQPLRRLYGTITAMQRMIYGPRTEAVATAARVRRIHDRVHGTLPEATRAYAAGTRYDANDPALLLWVHATLVATAVRTYEAFLPPLTAQEREHYYQESKLIGHLMGLETEQLPDGWQAFQDYYDAMVTDGPLEVTAVTRELARHILYPPVSWVPHVAGDVMTVVTAALLPETLAERYGLPGSRRRERTWRLARGVVRRTLPWLPGPARAGPRVWWAERRWRGRVSRQRCGVAETPPPSSSSPPARPPG